MVLAVQSTTLEPSQVNKVEAILKSNDRLRSARLLFFRRLKSEADLYALFQCLEPADHDWDHALKWNSSLLLVVMTACSYFSFMKNNKQLFKTMERRVNFS